MAGSANNAAENVNDCAGTPNVDPMDAAEAASLALEELRAEKHAAPDHTEDAAPSGEADDAARAAEADSAASDNANGTATAAKPDSPTAANLGATVAMEPDAIDAAEAAAEALASLNIVDGFAPALETAPLAATIHHVESQMENHVAATAAAREQDRPNQTRQTLHGGSSSDASSSESVADHAAAHANTDKNPASKGERNQHGSHTPASADAAAREALLNEETTVLPDHSLQTETTRMLPSELRHPRTVDETISYRRPGEAPMRLDQAAEERKRSKHMPLWQRGIIVVVLAGLVAGGSYLGYQWWQQRRADEAKQEMTAEHTLMNVTVPLEISGLTTSAASNSTAVGSKIPVQVSGQDNAGSVVDQVQYVDEKGKGMRLLPGTYTLSIAASPIAADGTIYAVPGDKREIKVQKDNADYSSAGMFKFDVPAADSITEGEINQAYKYASQGGASSDAIARILKQAAEDRRSAAVSATGSQSKELLKEADARHKATPSYSFDLPQAWYGHVTTAQNGNTIYVYLAGTQTLVCKLSLQKDGFAAGDVNDGALGSTSLGNGENVVVSGPTYPWVIQQTANGKTQDAVDTYSEDAAIELVQLQTGGLYTFEQIKAGIAGKDAQPADYQKLVQDYLANALVSSIKAS